MNASKEIPDDSKQKALLSAECLEITGMLILTIKFTGVLQCTHVPTVCS